MAKQDKFKESLVTILNKLKNGQRNVQEVVAEEKNEGRFQYEGGLVYALKALAVVDHIRYSWDGKKVSLCTKTTPPPEPTTPTTPTQPEPFAVDEEVERLSKTIAVLQKKLATPTPVVTNHILEIVVKDETKNTITSHKDTYHACFPRLLQLAQKRKNIFVYGPTGCGKSHVCEQLAKVLGLRFAFISCTTGMSEAKLEGRLLPLGEHGKFEYAISEFVDCYENGGVFLLDEIDAADPNVLLLINAALANGKMAVPSRLEKPYAIRHKDFICIAAANTVGLGADRLYAGRNQLDAATLSRFEIGKVMMDYDAKVEEAVCPDTKLRTRLQEYRAAVRANNLERSVSTRFMKDAYQMKVECGWTDSEIDNTLFLGWRVDEVKKVKSY